LNKTRLSFTINRVSQQHVSIRDTHNHLKPNLQGISYSWIKQLNNIDKRNYNQMCSWNFCSSGCTFLLTAGLFPMCLRSRFLLILPLCFLFAKAWCLFIYFHVPFFSFQFTSAFPSCFFHGSTPKWLGQSPIFTF
jgi:hypothetical protein